MKKSIVSTIVAASLVIGGTSVFADEVAQTSTTPVPTMETTEELKGLYNALQHVHNPSAREAILRNIAKYEAALKTPATPVTPPATTTGDTVTVQPVTPAAPQINITIKINGNVIVFDQEPMVVDGRTFVPLRAIFEQLGVNTQWDEKAKTVKASKGKKKMSLKIGSHQAMVDGKTVKLDQQARIVNGRTLVPLRFVSESIGAQVNWDGKTGTVDIKAQK
ncbi:copper amine oxidase-like protein [Aneurinibacillus soli]|uniref:Protease inhibitor n=1 Tax=Aneurinibacillus soli TaxID=1500254 RepID=A0A0U5BC68_9BACL|nr:copper amine oxidase N-terminal domain-containing protein [Aneurinibacillus soli]PYE61388.1 copper amine oxidase-like protein [Aneurinibacillus soli]BAU27783.1 Protease inhibitor precursor [Aneurinibacillus soli]